MGDNFEVHLLFSIFILAFSIRLYYYFRFFVPFSFAKKKSTASINLEGVSVIIAARNEEANLKAFLPLVMDQDYPLFEVIVVDDHSTDNSWGQLTTLNQRFELLNTLSLNSPKKGKKAALQLGISKAKYQNLLFIDADCYPASRQWIKGIVEEAEGKEIVLAYGRYEKRPGFLNKLVRFDALHTALRYLSFAKAGKPYMGVGRNLFYRRKVYENSTAFRKYAHLPYGDDDLLVNEMAKSQNTSIAIRVNSHTVSIPAKRISDFFLQKVRHLGTGKYYKTADKLNLGMEGVSRALLIVGAFALLLCREWMVLPFIFTMVILQYLVFAKTTDKLMDKDLIAYAPLLEVFHFIFLFICGIYSLFNRRTTWK